MKHGFSVKNDMRSLSAGGLPAAYSYYRYRFFSVCGRVPPA
ncbi:hypothetical protein HMPREF0860_0026 [Treponema socranskii subsp. socranskii VPI DR56BR1116 = ATCC 35536]|uniref:Lipoprotein n=1 Tax=Treponema socranskii subsp. socranskii VPI DR56BR1116 = ATCC 35536 TaxID=1125725 RepID=A0ABN0P7W0_TRESO|nr:hypothetical protein HMPREF0860_0026 [Treponema socranskii subsp. socranskii VPI DR56BR1116 = ATCC 35536]